MGVLGMTITVERKKIFYISCMAAFVLIVLKLPRMVMEKPELTTVAPSVVAVNSSFNSDNSLIVSGKKLENIVAIYVNNAWISDSSFQMQEDGTLKLFLPYYCYSDAEDLHIQIQTKETSDLFAKSNAVVCTVSDGSEFAVPTISNVNLTVLDGVSKDIFPFLEITGENFDSYSRILVNGRVCATTLADGKLTARLPFSLRYDQNDVELEVAQCYEECATSAASGMETLAVDDLLNYADTDEVENHFNERVLSCFLSGLKDDSIVAFIAVKDEASSGMTESARGALKDLGLQAEWNDSMFGESYLAVIDGGQLRYEQWSLDALEYQFEVNGETVDLRSAGYRVGNQASVTINGRDYAVNERGLNIVVYDKKMEKVIDSVSFDTYADMTLLHK